MPKEKPKWKQSIKVDQHNDNNQQLLKSWQSDIKNRETVQNYLVTYVFETILRCSVHIYLIYKKNAQLIYHIVLHYSSYKILVALVPNFSLWYIDIPYNYEAILLNPYSINGIIQALTFHDGCSISSRSVLRDNYWPGGGTAKTEVK